MSRADVVEDDEPANAAKTGAVVVEEDRYVETVGLLGPYRVGYKGCIPSVGYAEDNPVARFFQDSSRKRVGYC